ncbi:MAG: hypothetical protein QM758_24350 [Armatimonas sp.]
MIGSAVETKAPAFGPYYQGVAATVEKAGELAAGVETWLVGSPPPGVVDQADAFDSSVRLRLATVEFGSNSESQINQLFQVSAYLRSAYRGASEAIRLLTIMDHSAEVRAPFALTGDALATQARLAPTLEQLLNAEILEGSTRRGKETQRAAIGALAIIPRETMAGGHFATRRLQRACLICLEIAGTAFAEAISTLAQRDQVGVGQL